MGFTPSQCITKDAKLFAGLLPRCACFALGGFVFFGSFSLFRQLIINERFLLFISKGKLNDVGES